MLKKILYLITLSLFSAQISFAKTTFVRLDCADISCTSNLEVKQSDLIKSFPEDLPNFKIRFKPKALFAVNSLNNSVKFVVYEQHNSQITYHSSSTVKLSNKLNKNQFAELSFMPFTGTKDLQITAIDGSGTKLDTFNLNINASGDFEQLKKQNLNAEFESSIAKEEIEHLLFERLSFETSPNNSLEVVNTDSDHITVRLPKIQTKKRSKTINTFLNSNQEFNNTGSEANSSQEITINTDSKEASLTIAKKDPDKPHIVFKSAPLTSMPVNGSLEFFNNNLYFTVNGIRRKLVSNFSGVDTGGLGEQVVQDLIDDVVDKVNNPQTETLTGNTISFKNLNAIYNTTLTADLNLEFNNLNQGHRVVLNIDNSGGHKINLPSKAHITDGSFFSPLYSKYIVTFDVVDNTTNKERINVSIFNTGDVNLDNGAVAIYSLNKVNSSYNGPLIRIRREDNHNEIDIGFNNNNELDVAAITSHCAGTNCVVPVWYDQSSNGNNATQNVIINQPTIYKNATGLVRNSHGKPALEGNGVDDHLEFDFTDLVNSEYSIFISEERLNNASGSFFIGNQGFEGNERKFHIGYRSNSILTNGHYSNDVDLSVLPYGAPELRLHSVILNDLQGRQYHVNGHLENATIDTTHIQFHDAQSNRGFIFSGHDSNIPNFNHYYGNISNVFIYNTDKAELRRDIENVIKDLEDIN
jgi:hypothetical protein